MIFSGKGDKLSVYPLFYTSKTRMKKGKRGDFPLFWKKSGFFQKRCWQNSLGMILYMSCQRDSDTRELKKLISKPKTSDFDWNFGFKKKLKTLKKVLDKLKTVWYNKWVHFGERNAQDLENWTTWKQTIMMISITYDWQRIKLISLKLKYFTNASDFVWRLSFKFFYMIKQRKLL